MTRRRIILVLAGALVAFALWASRREPPTQSERPVAPPPAAALAPAPAEIPPLPEQPRLESGGTLWIDSRELDRSKPLTLELVLGEPSTSDAPLAVRFLVRNAAPHLGSAALSTDRTSARFDVDPAWLEPGRYVVEVKTTEPSHFPVRRYAIEVR